MHREHASAVGVPSLHLGWIGRGGGRVGLRLPRRQNIIDLKASECSRRLGLWRSNNSAAEPTGRVPGVVRNRPVGAYGEPRAGCLREERTPGIVVLRPCAGAVGPPPACARSYRRTSFWKLIAVALVLAAGPDAGSACPGTLIWEPSPGRRLRGCTWAPDRPGCALPIPQPRWEVGTPLNYRASLHPHPTPGV